MRTNTGTIMTSEVTVQDNITSVPGILDTLGESILDYVLIEIIPGLFATVCVVTLLVGVPMNILFLIATHRRGRLQQQPYVILFHVVAMDTVALICIVLPDLITAIAKKWLLGNAMCVIQGILVTSLFVMTFSYCVWSMLERVLYICYIFTYKSLFSKCNGKLFSMIISIQWVAAVAYCILPLCGVSAIEYQGDYGFQCDRTYSDSTALTHVHFVITYFITFIAFSVLSLIIVVKRLNQKDQSIIDIETGSVISDASSSISEAGPSSSTIINSVSNNGTGINGPGTSKSPDYTGEHRSVNKHNKSRRKKSMWDVEKDREAFLLASTVTLTWLITFGMWSVYVITAYLSVYEKASYPIWKGVYPIAVMIANLSYGMKPLVYVIHNKDLRADIRNTIPGKARNKYTEYNIKAKDTINSIEIKVKDKLHVIEGKIHRKTHQKIEADNSPASNSEASSMAEQYELGHMKRNNSDSLLDENFGFEHGHDPKPRVSMNY